MRAALVVLALALAPISAGAQDNKADAERALREIEAFTTMQARTDPHYTAVEEIMLVEIDAILKATPPREWAQVIRRRYVALSEAAHAKERARIRDVEREAAGGVVAPSSAAADRLVDRMDALEKDLHAGKIGPRRHALHALEAARAIFPADTHLITLRETKVSLATDYELGNLTRGQYDDRWARARAIYQQSADAREREILDEMRAEQAAIGRRAGPSLGDRIRQQQGIRCTTTTAFGVTETRCR